MYKFTKAIIMSRGFVKESDQEEVPIVPPRAELPPGLPNYVTRTGMEALEEEREDLIRQKNNLGPASESEHRIARNHIDALLLQLENRISTARVVEQNQQPQDEVRFGAKVTLRIDRHKKTKTFQIVGVDEADIGKGKISFVSPIAQAITGKKPGETALIKLPAGKKEFEIIKVVY